MRNEKRTLQKPISPLEHHVMDYLWANGPCTAEQIRDGLFEAHPLKDSTIRTLLRRLEEKGFAGHKVDGRTFIYSGLTRRTNVAVNAVRQIIDRFFGGSAEELVLGLVDDEVLKPHELRELARKIESRKKKLVPAAEEAVRKWRYKPTVLDGKPVEVVTQVEVHFTLDETESWRPRS